MSEELEAQPASPDHFLIPDEVELREDPGPAPVRVQRVSHDRPTPEKAQALVEVLDEHNGRWKLTENAKRARKELRNAACFDVLFNDAPVPESDRHNWLSRAVGEVVARVHGFPWASPQLVYGLLLPIADRLGEDDNNLPFASQLWEMATSFWHKEDEKRAQKSADVEQARAAVGPGPLILATPDRRYHVRTRDGGFDSLGVPKEHLVARIRELGMDDVIGIWQVNKDGHTSIKSAQKLLDGGFTASVARVVGRVGAQACSVEQAGTPEATLVIPLSAVRTDLPPLPQDQFAEIMDYYRHALPPEQLEHFLDCLAALPQEQHLTAAISVTGPGATGKDMLGEAVARLWPRGAARVDSIVGNFQEDLVDTAFIWVNETHGLPEGEVRKFAGKFRMLVAARRHVVQRKFRTNLEVERCYRAYLSANDEGLLHALLGGEGQDGSEAGLEATAMRVARFQFRQEGADWLSSRGGMKHTNGPGAEWVGGEPQRGGMRLPRFILDLSRMAQDGQRAIRHEDPKGRFLVRGTDLGTEGRDLILERSLGAEVVEEIVNALRQSPGPARGGVVHDGRTYAQAQALAEALSRRPRRPRVSPKAVAAVLKRLAPDGVTESERVENDTQRRRWWQIDRARLCEAARRLELDCGALELPARPATSTPRAVAMT